MRLKDKVALITGAAGGIGRMLVLAALDAGYRVALLDRDGEGLDRVCAEVVEPNRRNCVLAYPTDVAREEDCVEAVKRAEKQRELLKKLNEKRKRTLQKLRREQLIYMRSKRNKSSRKENK